MIRTVSWQIRINMKLGGANSNPFDANLQKVFPMAHGEQTMVSTTQRSAGGCT